MHVSFGINNTVFKQLSEGAKRPFFCKSRKMFSVFRRERKRGKLWIICVLKWKRFVVNYGEWQFNDIFACGGKEVSELLEAFLLHQQIIYDAVVHNFSFEIVFQLSEMFLKYFLA